MIGDVACTTLRHTTMFTYSHANTPLGQSERTYYLSYFINIIYKLIVLIVANDMKLKSNVVGNFAIDLLKMKKSPDSHYFPLALEIYHFKTFSND